MNHWTHNINMNIISGTQVAAQVLEEVKQDIENLKSKGVVPGLAVVLGGGEVDLII